MSQPVTTRVAAAGGGDGQPEPVNLVDLGIQRDAVAAEVAEGFARVMGETSFVLGPEVAAFEQEYADYCGAAHCVGVANGTDALELSLRAAGVGQGDEVIVPANTFIATAEAVVRAGAKPVLVDCDEAFLIDPMAVAGALSTRTRAVMAVHLYGQLADVGGLRAVGGPDLLLVEDAAQSQGARRSGQVSGSLGDIAATSFYPGKNLGAYGDAGAVTTSSEELTSRLRQLRNHGGALKYEHSVVGTNSRLDSLQAVVLRAKLRLLDEWNEQRRMAAEAYDELLAEIPGVVRPLHGGREEHVWHLYVVRVAQRDEVLQRLNRAGIGAGIHYPTPVHLTRAFAHLGHDVGSFPRSEAAASEILSLPIYPGITHSQQERVAHQLRRALA